MYLGILYIYTKFRPDQISNMAVRPGGHLGKSTTVYANMFANKNYREICELGILTVN
jgi:hypothetical protein